jgi:hypothetical protein
VSKDPDQRKLFNTHGWTSAREMNRFKKAKFIKELGLRAEPLESTPRVIKGAYSFGEFLMPDESREWLVKVGVCPLCGQRSHHRLHRICRRGEKPVFYMRCWNAECEFRTPEFPSSVKAIQHYKLVSTLAQ